MVTHPNATWARRDAAKAITTTHNHQVSIGVRFVSLLRLLQLQFQTFTRQINAQKHQLITPQKPNQA